MPRKDEKRDHIFVSVASYRDEACKRTIADLFAKADHPERITVGVVQQNQVGTAEDCVASCPSCLDQQKRGRIVVKDYDYTEARGPAYARWAASRLWDGSEFFLQIDAHSSFQPGWDRRILEQYRALGDPPALRATSPRALDGAALARVTSQPPAGRPRRQRRPGGAGPGLSRQGDRHPERRGSG